MFFYTAYGLTVESEICLPGFTEIVACDADIAVRRCYSAPRHDSPKMLTAERLDDGMAFFCPYGGLRYEIRNGREVLIHSVPGNQPELERLPLYGFAIAAILHQRGYFVLHASAVEIGGRAAIFAGGKFQGKSTLIASLVKRGHRLLSDDVTAIVCRDDGIVVLPGVSCIKLWPDAMEVLGLEVALHPELYTASIKRNYFIPEMSCPTERRLSGIFLLDEEQRLEIKELRTAERMFNLVAGCYFSRYQHTLSPRETEKLFRQCAYFAAECRVMKLNRPISAEFLGETMQLVENWVEGN